MNLKNCMKPVLAGLATLASFKLNAQSQMPKDLSDLSDKVKENTSGVIDIIEIIIIIGLAIGLATTIYMVVTKNAHSREWIVGLIVGFVLYFVFFNMLTIA